jgi:hypothetical protein
MAVTDFNPAQKPHVYDLLNRLNAAFARVSRNMDALGQTGIFDPQSIERLHRLQEEVRSDTNSRLLKTLQDIEERDLTELRKTT